MMQPLLRRLVFDVPLLTNHTKIPLKVSYIIVVTHIHRPCNVCVYLDIYDISEEIDFRHSLLPAVDQSL